MFSSKSFRILDLIFKSVINFELTLYTVQDSSSKFIFSIWISGCPNIICSKDYSFSIELFWHMLLVELHSFKKNVEIQTPGIWECDLTLI